MNVVNQLLELVTLWMRKIIVKSIIVQNAIVVQNVENKLLDTWLGRIPRHFIPVKYIYFFREIGQINFTKISYYFWRVPKYACMYTTVVTCEIMQIESYLMFFFNMQLTSYFMVKEAKYVVEGWAQSSDKLSAKKKKCWFAYT